MFMRIALVSGFWGQNIGNAFFNLGGRHVVERMFPGATVEFIQDQPGYRTFHQQRQGNPRNDFGLLQHADVDAIVLQGPMLTETFRALWEPTLRAMKHRGTRLVLLSAAMFRYTKAERELNRAFLKEVEPAILSTRDRPTYEAFHDLAEHAWCGVDSAFYAPEVYRPIPLACAPYVTVNYDRFPEPSMAVSPSKDQLPEGRYDREFEALGLHWGLRYPRWHEWMAHRGKVQSYLAAFLDRRRLPESVGGYVVVRPEHRFNPHVTWKVYRQPNAVASDEPWTYFTIYAGSSLTLSDRVHACVATLAYGKPAMLYKHTRRAALFDRLDLEDIGERPVILDPVRLGREKADQLSFLEAAVKRVSWRSGKGMAMGDRSQDTCLTMGREVC
jgi:hypothetical protein